MTDKIENGPLRAAQKVYLHIRQDSLYRNSLFLMANTGILAVLGFIYWAIASHFYATSSVGITAAVIATAGMISSLSMLGFDSAFIRFLPGSDHKDEYLDTGIVLSSLAALFISAIYLVAIRLFVPQLSLFVSSWVYLGTFMTFMVLNMLNNITNFAFIAIRSAHVIALVNLAFGLLRLIGLIALARYGLNGMLLAQVIAVVIAVLLTFRLMHTYLDYHFRLRFLPNVFRQVKSYAINSYASSTLLVLPSLLLPTIVISEIGPASSAYFYIVSVLITALNVIPLAISQSLFAESTWDPDFRSIQLKKALKATGLLFLPSIIILVILAHSILVLFGHGYAQSATGLLIILALSALPKAANYIMSTLLRVNHKLTAITKINAVYAFVILVGSILMLKLGAGLNAIGIVTLAAELIAMTLNTSAIYYHRVLRKPGSVAAASGQV